MLQLGLYLAMAPEPKTLYTEGGDKAVTQFEAGYTGFTTRPFRGLNVVTSEPFEVSDGEHTHTHFAKPPEHFHPTPPQH